MPHDSANSIGQRLKKARESLGLTLKEVAKKMGFSNYQTVSNIETSKREAKAWELAKLAQIYYRDINYFLSEREDAGREPIVLWRKAKNVEDFQNRLHQRRFLNYCNNYYSLEQMLGLDTPTKFRPIPSTKDDFAGFYFVEELASKYSRILDLGSRPAWSLSKILDERFAVKIRFLAMGHQESGASTIGDFGPAILINSNDSPWRRNYDLAHEFFHIVTWNIFKPEELYSDDEQKNKGEQFADVFASALLLPDQEVREEFENRRKNNTISYFDCIEIARQFGVSTQAFLWRLVNLNLIKKRGAKKVLDDPKLRRMDKEKRYGDWKDVPEFPSRYVDLAFRGMQLGLISRGIFAQYVEIDRQEIGQFLKRYGLNENEDYGIELATT